MAFAISKVRIEIFHFSRIVLRNLNLERTEKLISDVEKFVKVTL